MTNCLLQTGLLYKSQNFCRNEPCKASENILNKVWLPAESGSIGKYWKKERREFPGLRIGKYEII